MKKPTTAIFRSLGNQPVFLGHSLLAALLLCGHLAFGLDKSLFFDYFKGDSIRVYTPFNQSGSKLNRGFSLEGDNIETFVAQRFKLFFSDRWKDSAYADGLAAHAGKLWLSYLNKHKPFSMKEDILFLSPTYIEVTNAELLPVSYTSGILTLIENVEYRPNWKLRGNPYTHQRLFYFDTRNGEVFTEDDLLGTVNTDTLRQLMTRQYFEDISRLPHIPSRYKRPDLQKLYKEAYGLPFPTSHDSDVVDNIRNLDFSKARLLWTGVGLLVVVPQGFYDMSIFQALSFQVHIPYNKLSAVFKPNSVYAFVEGLLLPRTDIRSFNPDKIHTSVSLGPLPLNEIDFGRMPDTRRSLRLFVTEKRTHKPAVDTIYSLLYNNGKLVEAIFPGTGRSTTWQLEWKGDKLQRKRESKSLYGADMDTIISHDYYEYDEYENLVRWYGFNGFHYSFNTWFYAENSAIQISSGHSGNHLTSPEFAFKSYFFYPEKICKEERCVFYYPEETKLSSGRWPKRNIRTRYFYNDEMQLIQQQSYSGDVVMLYDKRGRLSEKHWPDGRFAIYDYTGRDKTPSVITYKKGIREEHKYKLIRVNE